MAKRTFSSGLLALWLATSLGCAHARVGAEDVQRLGGAVTKLSASVEAYARKNPPAGIVDEAFLQAATAHDPGLLKPFSGYTLKVVRQGRTAVLLVCDEHGKEALIEDATCSSAVDQRYSATPRPACGIHVNTDEACK